MTTGFERLGGRSVRLIYCQHECAHWTSPIHSQGIAMHMDKRWLARRHRNGYIDIEFYAARAKHLRAQALAQFFRAIRHHVLIALRKLSCRVNALFRDRSVG